MEQGNPSEKVPVSDQKEDSNAVTELLKEALGYEQGLWRTLLDLRKMPVEVLNGYLSNTRKYTSPFKLLTTSLSLWLLINGFLIDWYTIWSELCNGVLKLETSLIAWIGDFDAARKEALVNKVQEGAGPIFSMISQVFGDLFSKWYVPFAILAVIGASWLFTKRNRELGIPMKTVMSVLSYSVGSNIPLYLILSIAFGIHVYLGLGLILIMGIFMILGRSKNFMYAAPGKFFPGQPTVEKKLMKATFLVTVALQLLLVLGYVLYFKFR